MDAKRWRRNLTAFRRPSEATAEIRALHRDNGPNLGPVSQRRFSSAMLVSTARVHAARRISRSNHSRLHHLRWAAQRPRSLLSGEEVILCRVADARRPPTAASATGLGATAAHGISLAVCSSPAEQAFRADGLRGKQ